MKCLRKGAQHFFYHSWTITLVTIYFFLCFHMLNAQTIEKGGTSLLEKEIEKIPSTDLIIDQINESAMKYRFRTPDSVLYYAKKLLLFGKENNDTKGTVLGTMREGDYYSDLGIHNNALQRYYKAEEMMKDIENTKLKADLYIQLTIEYFYLGQLKKALEAAYRAINISRQNGLIWEEAQVRHVLGFIYTQNKFYEEADQEISKAIQLWKKTNDSIRLYGSRSNLARNAILSGDIKKAKKFFEGNIVFFAKSKETLWLARSFMVQSHIHLEEGDWDKALISNKKYDSLLRKLKNPRDRILTYSIYSHLYFLTKNYSKAKQYADSTIYHALELQDSVELLDGYESLSKIALEKLDYSEAAKYSSLALPIREVLTRKSRDNNLKLMRTKIELEYQQLEKEVKDNKKLMGQRRITVISLILLGIFIGLSILGRRTVQKRKLVNAELQELNQTKNKLFSIIGHDLKSPISTLQELLELYDSRTISKKEVSNALQRLKYNVDYSAFTLNNLLFWANTQMNGLKSKPEKVLIKDKIRLIYDMYGAKLEKKNITIQCEIDQHSHVYVDSLQFEIVLRNLISNAIKFTPNGGKITFASYKHSNVADISICDSGMGMDQLTIERLKNSNAIEPKEGTEKEKGTGLGLLICKELIALNHGHLSIESEIDKGSCLKIQFPTEQI
ncbi:MAG: ATP-binding protein [Croceivirga sp.]